MYNTATQVDDLIAQMKRDGLSKSDIVSRAAVACLGWPYVFGARGEYCTPSNRTARKSDEYPTIVSACQVLAKGKDSCSGCKWYPGGKTRFFDCRGFTYWLLRQVGITINGAGATSQWNDNNNWTVKGELKDMPNVVCVVFKRVGTKMEHTGMHIGNGRIIHASVGVQDGKTTDKGWTHYAIPVGMDGSAPEPSPTPETTRPTIRNGSSGQCVKECQTLLMNLGYDVGPKGADGKFGPNTEKAVRAFQSDSSIKVDGIVGKTTWAYLFAADKKEPVEHKYTVTIPHLTDAQATALLAQYAGATRMTE